MRSKSLHSPTESETLLQQIRRAPAFRVLYVVIAFPVVMLVFWFVAGIVANRVFEVPDRFRESVETPASEFTEAFEPMETRLYWLEK